MKRKIFQTKNFSKTVDNLLKKRLLKSDNFHTFQRELAENPEVGDIIPGTGGIRKTKLKSATKGKSGGFRICYYYLVVNEEIYLLLIYAKNIQENLTIEEKKILKEFVNTLKKTK